MKTLLSFSFFILFFSLSTATAQQHLLKAGGGFGSVPYEATGGWNWEVQYQRPVMDKLSFFLALGTNGDDFTTSGSSKGTANGETWNNTWSFNYSERFHYIDLGVREQLFRFGDRYSIHSGIGATLGQSVFKYPETILIERGIITQREDVTRRVEVLMFHIALEQQYRLTDHLMLGLNASFRTTFGERHVLERVMNLDIGTVSSTSGIRNVAGISLQLGYVF